MVADVIAHRSSAAFDRLHGRYERLAVHIANDFTSCSAERDDIVQESFARAWERLDQLRDPSRFRPWFCQIVRRVALDAVRRRQRVEPFEDDVFGFQVSTEPAPDELAELAELAGSLDVALGQLKPRDATAITLATQFGFGPNEIAAALDVSPGNAKVILHRARTRLRRELTNAVLA